MGFAAPAIVRAASIMPVSVVSQYPANSIFLSDKDYWGFFGEVSKKFQSSIADPKLKYFLAKIDGISIFISDFSKTKVNDRLAANAILKQMGSSYAI